ncbi:MarR family winged helix-turn-helix transcriptional regulator [Microbacterium sp. NPDC055357]
MSSQEPGEAEQIVAALAQLRGGRPGRPPGPGFGQGPFGSRAQHPEHAGHRGGHHAGHGRGHGPMGRFAARFRLLEALAATPTALSVSELAERIGVDQPRASRLVQAAVAEGHVRREANPDDARRTDIVLTDAGRSLVAQARSARVDAAETASPTSRPTSVHSSRRPGRADAAASATR